MGDIVDLAEKIFFSFKNLLWGTIPEIIMTPTTDKALLCRLILTVAKQN